MFIFHLNLHSFAARATKQRFPFLLDRRTRGYESTQKQHRDIGRKNMKINGNRQANGQMNKQLRFVLNEKLSRFIFVQDQLLRGYGLREKRNASWNTESCDAILNLRRFRAQGFAERVERKQAKRFCWRPSLCWILWQQMQQTARRFREQILAGLTLSPHVFSEARDSLIFPAVTLSHMRSRRFKGNPRSRD